jgi:hypothetical protein
MSSAADSYFHLLSSTTQSQTTLCALRTNEPGGNTEIDDLLITVLFKNFRTECKARDTRKDGKLRFAPGTNQALKYAMSQFTTCSRTKGRTEGIEVKDEADLKDQTRRCVDVALRGKEETAVEKLTFEWTS